MVGHVIKVKGTQNTLRALLTEEVQEELISGMRVPDWTLLYLKLLTRTPDSAWQTLLNVTHLGKSRQNSDTPLLVTKNQIKAIKALVFKEPGCRRNCTYWL